MPLCNNNTLQKIIILYITPTVWGLLTWDLIPRWTIILYFDYLIIITVRHDNTFVTLLLKSLLETLLPRLLNTAM